MTDEVKAAVVAELGLFGFKKKNRLWRRDQEGICQVVELQRSTRGNYYYLNLGILLDEVEPDKRIKHSSDCHLDGRLESLVSDELREPLIRALDNDAQVGLAARMDVIHRALLEFAEPAFAKFSSREDILAFAKRPQQERVEERFTVWWPLLEFVGIKRRIPSDPDFDSRWIP